MESMIPRNKKGTCFRCLKNTKTEEHHIFEGSTRSDSEDFGLKIDLCRDCHNYMHSAWAGKDRQALHEMAQEEFEKHHTREEFIKHFIKSYL